MPWHGPDGHRLYYEDDGRGDAVVVMAGWAGSITDLSQLRAALLPGFRVIAVDLPGSGRSQPQRRSYEAGYYHDDAPDHLPSAARGRHVRPALPARPD